MDQTSTNAIPAAIRPPATLLALESTSSAAGGDGDAGNYRVSYHCLQSSVLNAAILLTAPHQASGLEHHVSNW